MKTKQEITKELEQATEDYNKEFSDVLIPKEKFGNNCEPCHRLDRNTLGIVLFAKNEESEKILKEHKGFIHTEPTTVKTRDGRTHHGSLLYTLKPIKPIEEAYFEKQIALATARMNARKALEKYEKRKKGVV